WERPLPANQWGWGPLMRDQSYISGVARVVEETGRKLVGEKLVGGSDKGKGRDDKSDKLVGEARKEAVELVRLPKEMSRRAKNSSRWDHKGAHMEWTVEVIFRPPPAKDPSAPLKEPKFISPPAQSSNATLYAVLRATLDSKDRKGKGKEVTEEDKEWNLKERTWLASHAPPPIVATTSAKDDSVISSADEPSLAPSSTNPLDTPSPSSSLSAIPAAPLTTPDDTFTLLLSIPSLPSS
ncbi:hypothetical protein P7C70_g9377, partial [Phenoliferia sp. Uapishka_3]